MPRLSPEDVTQLVNGLRNVLMGPLKRDVEALIPNATYIKALIRDEVETSIRRYMRQQIQFKVDGAIRAELKKIETE